MSPRSHLLFGSLVVSLLVAPQASAAPPWVDRPLTLPGGDWAFDFGAGVAHDGPPDVTEPGVNAEMAVGLTDRIELGLRTGIRFGDDAERSLHADQYGRLFDRQYVDGGDRAVANPEFRIRGALLRGPVELALEGRVFVPIEDNDAAVEFGVPLAFHLGDRVRLDTGAYVPVIFEHPTAFTAVRLPLDVWIQATRRLSLGPMTGVVFDRPWGVGSFTEVSLGFGLGFQITRYLDFKTMLLFPDINQDSRNFGVGAGVQIRIE